MTCCEDWSDAQAEEIGWWVWDRVRFSKYSWGAGSFSGKYVTELTFRDSSSHCDWNSFKCPSWPGLCRVRLVSLVSKKECFFLVIFVKEKHTAWSGLYDDQRKIIYAIYIFKQRKTGVSVLYFSLLFVILAGHWRCIWNCVFAQGCSLAIHKKWKRCVVMHDVPQSPQRFRSIGPCEILAWHVNCSRVKRGESRRNFPYVLGEP